MRSTALLLAASLSLAFPASADETAPAGRADQLQEAIARIRAQVDAQRAKTGSAAKDEAERAAGLDRLVSHMATLEHQNDELRRANAKLAADLDEALRKARRMERENDALAKVASSKLQELVLAGRQLVAARTEMDRIDQTLGELEAGRAVLTAVAQDLPLLVAEQAPAHPDIVLMRAELERARARIKELEAAAR